MGEEEDAALAALLEANGYITDDAGSSKLAEIMTLEMFLQDYPRMAALSNFTALTELRLLDQRIEKIEGLHGCPRLKKLWLTENRISVVENLEPCTALQELYLTSNRITEISGIAHLSSLQVLWLADNYISSIAGLSQLTGLHQLNLARNDITVVGNSLQQNTGLSSLNLADNRVCSMRDVVSGLSCLSSLQDLCFGDPFWGDCPVTSLRNYQTFMLAHLPQLTSLDTLGLAQETKAVAAATFGKKQLYYNMRNRTLGRALGDLCRAAEAVQQAEASKWLEVNARLVYAAKLLVDDCKQSGVPSDAAEQQVQQQVLQDCMKAVTQQLVSQRQCVSQNCRAARAMLQAATLRLQLELGSAGNIWLEEGQAGDAWVQSCHELLRSNSSSPKAGTQGGKQQQAGHVQILSATRIHNRHLRTQFAQHQEAGPEDFQTLFVCDAAANYLSIAEHGFDPVHNRWDPHAAVRLSSCLPAHPGSSSSNCADGSSSSSSSSSVQVLVCRACLAGPCKALPADDGQPDSFDTRQYPGLKALYRNLSSSGNGSSGGKASARLWYVCDHTALLPEYIITYQHTDTAPPKQDVSSSASTSTSSSGSKPECIGGTACKDALLQLCARPLQSWLAADRQQDAGPVQELGSRELWDRCAAVLATTRQQQQPRLPQLTPVGLQAVCGGQQLSALTRLSLQDCGCSSFAGLLCHLPNLAVLALPFNSITSLVGLAQPTTGSKLAVLDVSHNSIATWACSWLQDCTALTALDASCNKIGQPADLQALSRSTPQLRELDLRFNPVQYHKAYSVALSAVSSLAKLDGVSVQQQDPNTDSCLTLGGLRDTPSLWHSSTGPISTPHTLGADDWRTQLHSVVLEGRGFRSLAGLAVAHKLVAANLADNLISDLAGLSGCTGLQQLNISNNLVAELRPLSSLSSLRQLHMSCNQISSLAALSRLTALTSLSCEGNAVASLVQLSSFSSLVELYAAHNAVSDIKEVERLSVLPHLVVLDLVGNPVVCATEGYRLLLLFKLRALKVLDGVAADAAELAAAQAEYAGRLTLSLLEEELLPGCELSSLRHLDLTAAGIKDLGSVFAANGPFTALTGLTLDSNHLTNLAPLSGLTRLMSLHINSNKSLDGNTTSTPAGTASSTSTLCFEKPCGPDAPHSHGIRSLTEASSHPSMLRVLLPALQTLQLASCGLTSLAPLKLQCLPALRSLFVQGNELSKLDGLGGLVQLRELVADKNRIRVFEPEALSSCVRLQELRLEDNLIRSINPPSSSAAAPAGLGGCLPALRVLRLASNRMMDAAECAQRLADIPCLEEVTLAGNPFVRKQPAYRQLFIITCSQLQSIDGQPVTADERDILLSTAAVDSPRGPADMPQYTAAMLLAAAAAASAGDTRTAAAGLPLGRLAAAGCGSDMLGSPKAQGFNPQGFSSPGLLPTMVNFEGLANLTTARQNLLALGATASGLPGMMPASVPSIQSGVLVLTGPASFGLEGTSMRGSSSSSPGAGSGIAGAGASPHPSPSKLASKQQQQQSSPGGGAGRGSSRRTTTGSIASYRAGGFVVRQATFQY